MKTQKKYDHEEGTREAIKGFVWDYFNCKLITPQGDYDADWELCFEFVRQRIAETELYGTMEDRANSVAAKYEYMADTGIFSCEFRKEFRKHFPKQYTEFLSR